MLVGVAWVASAFLPVATTADPTQRAVVVVRFSQFRRPATLLPVSRYVLRVGTGTRAGKSGSGDRAFSSDSTLASLGFRASFVLRDFGHSKAQIGRDPRSLRQLASYCEVAFGQNAKRRNNE